MSASKRNITPIRVEADGARRIGATRVSLDSVFLAFEDGATPEEIVYRFPTLNLAEVYRTLAYCLDNLDEVRAYVEEQRRLGDEMQDSIRASKDISKAWQRLVRMRRGAA